MVAYSHKIILCVLYTVPVGYVIAFNATEYEFDVSVYSPVGTVVFEALLFVENVNNFTTIAAGFVGNEFDYSPFSINGMNFSVLFIPITRNPLLRVALDEHLDLNDEEAIYQFRIDVVGVPSQGGMNTELNANVIVHEIGKLPTCLMAVIKYFHNV